VFAANDVLLSHMITFLNDKVCSLLYNDTCYLDSLSWLTVDLPIVTDCFSARSSQVLQVVVWHSSSALVSINEVNLHRAWLVLGWV